MEGYEHKAFLKKVAAAFWIFNLLYLVGISLVAGPMLLQKLYKAVELGNAPSHQLVVIAAAILLPFAAMGFAHLTRLGDDSRSLSEFLVGVELPIAGVLLGRSIWAHELTTTSLLLYCFMLGIAACQCWLLVRRHNRNADIAPSSVTALSALVATGGLYLSALAIVFTSPLTVGALIGSIYLIIGGLAATVFFPPALLAVPVGVGVLFFGIYALWFVLYVPYCFVKQYLLNLKSTPALGRSLSIGVVVLCVVAFLMLHSDARKGTFAKLTQNQTTDTEQSELLKISEEIRTELLDAHLSPIRYLPQDFGFHTTHPLVRLRNSLMGVLLPTLVYQGNADADSKRAEREYEAFFDAPIQRAERESILAAHKNHWSPNRDLSAGLLDIGQRTVHVESQKLNMEVIDGVATIKLQEVLRNRTTQRLETLQYFTLPEDAVVTGLWLSDRESDPEMFSFQVAPRGAAQQVYKEEVRRRVDPALLELVGPRQYRLRVFPILPHQPMVVTMTYKTLPDIQGNWPLPMQHEQRNIFWDEKTLRTVNNQVADAANESSRWLPTTLPAASKVAGKLEYVDNNNYIYARPLPWYNNADANQRIAVLVDGSYSMRNQSAVLGSSLQKLSGSDIFFCKSECVQTHIEEQNNWVFYGNSQPLQQLRKFESNFNGYDAVFHLSDGGSYELQEKDKRVNLSAATWLVELGEGVYAYHDHLIDSVRSSGGGVVQSVEQAMVDWRLQTDLTGFNISGSDTPVAVTARHIWYERPANSRDNSNTQLSEIIGGLKIKQLSDVNDSIESLDALHDIAVSNGIVSSYSSMIVLVNDRQRERLKNLSSGRDRYDREVETGKKQQRRRVANAVPEPHEWALMALGLLLLSFTAYKRGWTIETVWQRNTPAF